MAKSKSITASVPKQTFQDWNARQPKRTPRVYRHPASRTKYTAAEVRAIIAIARKVEPSIRTTAKSLGLVAVGQ